MHQSKVSHQKQSTPANIIPADGVGTQHGPGFLPHGFPQDIHPFPKVVCTYADSEDNCPCKKAALVTHGQLHGLDTQTHSLRGLPQLACTERQSRSLGIVEWVLPPKDCRLTSMPKTTQKSCTRSSLPLAAQGFSKPSPTSLWEPQGVRKLLREPDPQPTATRRYCSPRAAKSTPPTSFPSHTDTENCQTG